MRNRARDQEEEVKESSDEESSDEERNDEERMLWTDLFKWNK